MVQERRAQALVCLLPLPWAWASACPCPWPWIWIWGVVVVARPSKQKDWLGAVVVVVEETQRGQVSPNLPVVCSPSLLHRVFLPFVRPTLAGFAAALVAAVSIDAVGTAASL